MSGTIQSGAGSDLWKIDAKSKAARVTLYVSGTTTIATNTKSTYSAATDTILSASADTSNPFFVAYGSSTKLVKVNSITVSGLTTSGSATLIGGVVVRKYSSTPTGGSNATVLTQVPHDSTFSAGSLSLCQVYGTNPTAGTLVGSVAESQTLLKGFSTVVDGAKLTDLTFTFGDGVTQTPLVLSSSAQGVGLVLQTATSVSMSIKLEWTEE